MMVDTNYSVSTKTEAPSVSGCSEGHNSEVQCLWITLNVLLAHLGSILYSTKHLVLVQPQDQHPI